MLFNQCRAAVVFLRAFRTVPVKMVWATAFDKGDSLVKVNRESVASYFYYFRGGEMAAPPLILTFRLSGAGGKSQNRYDISTFLLILTFAKILCVRSRGGWVYGSIRVFSGKSLLNVSTWKNKLFSLFKSQFFNADTCIYFPCHSYYMSCHTFLSEPTLTEILF